MFSSDEEVHEEETKVLFSAAYAGSAGYTLRCFLAGPGTCALFADWGRMRLEGALQRNQGRLRLLNLRFV